MRNENKCVLYESKAMIITAACVEALNNQTHEAFRRFFDFIQGQRANRPINSTACDLTLDNVEKPDASS